MTFPPNSKPVSQIREILLCHNLGHHGFATLERPLTFDFYRAWIEAGHQGDMAYLKDHLALKENPRALGRNIESAIVVARSYYPHPYATAPPESGPTHGQSLRTAMYAKGSDYHHSFLDELEGVVKDLSVLYPNEEFLCFTDSSPILERDLANRAGLGWVGKNTCLINPQHGSLFWIGEILTSLALGDVAARVADHCGTCDRCIVACPTGAIEQPRVLNATKCIAYWTIEARAAAPKELADKFGNWFFGCDICQTVCPWNQKVFGREAMANLTAPSVPRGSLIEDLRWVLTSTNRALRRAFASSALAHARPLTLKRNALTIVANESLVELLPEVNAAAENPALKLVADRTLAQLSLRT